MFNNMMIGRSMNSTTIQNYQNQTNKPNDSERAIVKTSDTIIELLVWALDVRYRTGYDSGYPIRKENLLEYYNRLIKESSIESLAETFKISIEIRTEGMKSIDVYGKYNRVISLYYDKVCEKYNLLAERVDNEFRVITTNSGR